MTNTNEQWTLRNALLLISVTKTVCIFTVTKVNELKLFSVILAYFNLGDASDDLLLNAY